MLPTIGFITLQEADSILDASLTYSFWTDPTVYDKATGTYKTNTPGTTLIGTGTLATSELPLGNDIELEYNIGKVSSVTDNLTVITDVPFDAPDDSVMKILTPTQRTNLENLWIKKRRALQSAYDLIFAFINIPDVITEQLERAQAYLAGNLFYTLGKSTSISGVEKNVTSFSIGDMSYSFNTVASMAGNSAYEVFPEPIYTLLFPYFKNSRVFAPITTSAR